MRYQVDMTGYKPEDVIVEMHEAADTHQSPYVVIHGEHNDKTGGLFLSFFSFYRLRMSHAGKANPIGPGLRTRTIFAFMSEGNSLRIMALFSENSG